MRGRLRRAALNVCARASCPAQPTPPRRPRPSQAAAAAAAAAASDDDDLVDATSYSTSPGRLHIVTQADYEKWTHTGSTETAASVVAGLALIGLSFSRWRAVAAANAAAAKAA